MASNFVREESDDDDVVRVLREFSLSHDPNWGKPPAAAESIEPDAVPDAIEPEKSEMLNPNEEHVSTSPKKRKKKRKKNKKKQKDIPQKTAETQPKLPTVKCESNSDFVAFLNEYYRHRYIYEKYFYFFKIDLNVIASFLRNSEEEIKEELERITPDQMKEKLQAIIELLTSQYPKLYSLQRNCFQIVKNCRVMRFCSPDTSPPNFCMDVVERKMALLKFGLQLRVTELEEYACFLLVKIPEMVSELKYLKENDLKSPPKQPAA